ncbi:MAG: septum site-determining protein MinC [Bacillota bacterium]|nr:septum site-determining protein MinC [Bacillota bacterium]
MAKNIINIKGTPSGLVFYFDNVEAGFGQLCAALEDKLLSSGDFFINADYIIDSPHQFTAEELAVLEEIMAKYHLHRGQVMPHEIPSDEKYEVIYQTAGGNSLLVTKGIRNGQRMSVRGNAVIMGDINPGGEIIATGNIVVMGSCRGVLHAGAEGDDSCYILAYNMLAQQLRIGSHVATVPSDAGSTPLKLAVVQENAIVLMDYIPSQFRESMAVEEG